MFFLFTRGRRNLNQKRKINGWITQSICGSYQTNLRRHNTSSPNMQDKYVNMLHNHVTVPGFYFPIFAFAHRSLNVRSTSVQRAFIVRTPCVHRLFNVCSLFTVLRSPFSVRSHSLITNHSSFIHCAFSYRSQNVNRYRYRS